MQYFSLQQILEGGQFVTTDELNLPGNESAALELQSRLCDLGLLDPVFDGDENKPFKPVAKGDAKIGVNSRAAIREFCRFTGILYEDRVLKPELIAALLKADPQVFLPVEFNNAPGDDQQTHFAKRVLRYLRDQGYWIARSPYMYNIVYVEGANVSGHPNRDEFNQWNDRRLVIRIGKFGKPMMVVNDQATTEPGNVFTTHPLNNQGAARIAFGQYKAWVDGLHKGVQPALVQRQNVKVHRDLNKDGMRSSRDPIDIGSTFGINQHGADPGRLPVLVNGYSAGCLVGRRYEWHLSFLETVRKDTRYQQNKGYLFVSAVIAGDDLAKQQPV